jgi:hypothetical protein
MLQFNNKFFNIPLGGGDSHEIPPSSQAHPPLCASIPTKKMISTKVLECFKFSATKEVNYFWCFIFLVIQNISRASLLLSFDHSSLFNWNRVLALNFETSKVKKKFTVHWMYLKICQNIKSHKWKCTFVDTCNQKFRKKIAIGIRTSMKWPLNLHVCQILPMEIDFNKKYWRGCRRYINP